jgi:hypothetical protein
VGEVEDLGGPSARRGLSEVMAAVLIIAIIIVTFAVTSGLWFGMDTSLGSSANTALVQVDEAVVPSAIPSGEAYVYCSNDTSVTDGAHIHLYNQGTATVSAKVLDIAYGGATARIALSGTCTVAPGSGLSLIILSLPNQAAAAESYSGYVSLTNGSQVRFAGTFV